MAPKIPLSRREFVKDAGGLIIGFSLMDASALPRLLAAPADDAMTPPSPGQLDGWLRIEKDETIRFFSGKAEIGMGVQTALSQIVAEELDAPFEHIQFVMGDTATTPDQGGVGGSTSVAQGAKPLRNAAATARFVLLQLGSQRLGAPVEQLQTKNGFVSVNGDASKSVSYGELAGATDLREALKVTGNGFGLNVEGAGKPKMPSAYTVVGQPIPRVDMRPKVMGQFTYMGDVRVPGMLHGRVVRPAGVGATFVSVDDSAAKASSGVRQDRGEGQFCGRGCGDRVGLDSRVASAQGSLDRGQDSVSRAAGFVPAFAFRHAEGKQGRYNARRRCGCAFERAEKAASELRLALPGARHDGAGLCHC